MNVPAAKRTRVATARTTVPNKATKASVPKPTVGNQGNDVRKRKALGNIENQVLPKQNVRAVPSTKVLPNDGKRKVLANLKNTVLPKTSVVLPKKRPLVQKPVVAKVGPKVITRAVARVTPFRVNVQADSNPEHVDVPLPESPEAMDIGEPEPGPTAPDTATGLLVIPNFESQALDSYDEYSSYQFDYLHQQESEFTISENFMEHQTEVTYKMREILVDWLNEVHLNYELIPETFYHTVALIDFYLQKCAVPKRQFQLLGVTAMFLASKYEEVHPPEICDFIYITDSYCSKKDILSMELKLLKTLEFRVGRPLPIAFLRRITTAAEFSELGHTMSKYFLELSSLDYKLCYLPPSLLAAASSYLAFKLLSDVPWSEELVRISGYAAVELESVAKKLARRVSTAGKTKENGVRSKYSHAKYFKVSVHPEVIACDHLF